MSHLGSTDPGQGDDVVGNEFAAVRVQIDRAGLTPRLLLEDLDSGETVLLDPLELVSLVRTQPEARYGWIRVGPYADEVDGASALDSLPAPGGNSG